MPENMRHRLALIGQQPGERGRNTKYDPDHHCWLVRDLAQRGEFPEAWAAEAGVTLNTMRVWVNTHPEFREAVIIAQHLLQTYWTREFASARNNPNAKPGIYAIIARRFPEFYGQNPADIFAILQTPVPAAEGQSGAEHTITTADGVQQMTDEEIQKRLETLRQRRAAEREEP